jgi:hypothetical protein
MTALSIQPTFPIFTDIDGQPLEDGYVFIGTANLNPITNPITVYWDAALTLTAVQPIRTLGGYPMNSGTPARLYVNSDYSIQVQNKNGSLIYSALAAGDRFSDVVVQDISSTEVTFLQAGTGAVTRTAQAKMRETVSVFDFMSDAQKADVLAGTALVDTLNAFNAAKESFIDTFNTTFYKQGGTIEVPPGKYYLSSTFSIDRNIVLRGQGTPYGNCAGISQLIFADNVDGILCVDYRSSPSNKQGSGITIQGLHLSRKNTSGTLGSGISLKTTARIRDVTCVGFREHGIKIDASTSYSPASNANLWEIHSCTLDSNGGSGLYVNGADANAGSGYNVNAVNNGAWGIYDSSFLGNTYVACHTDSNVSGAYKTDDNNARNVFIGCYSEGGQPTSSFVQPTIIMGGLHSAGVAGTGAYLNNSNTGLKILNSWPFVPTGGIYFAETTKTSETSTLDDYRELTWTPVATNLTVVGTATISGVYTVIGNRVFFNIEISVSGGSTASTANSTRFSLPIIPASKSVAATSSSNVASLGTSLIDSAAGGIVWSPTWAATADVIYIAGQYRISSV